jgi:hypothetical protein
VIGEHCGRERLSRVRNRDKTATPWTTCPDGPAGQRSTDTPDARRIGGRDGARVLAKRPDCIENTADPVRAV